MPPVLVSIIVPVYNASRFLNSCVDSLLAQTVTDFEIVLVDDGSKDNSPEICDEYAQKHTNVIVVHKANGGVSSARNAGLDVARGKYVVYVDSDDEVAEDYLASFCLTEHYDFQMMGNVVKTVNGETPNRIKSMTLFGKDILKEITDYSSNKIYFFYPPWAKLFSRAIIEEFHLRFDETSSIGEDYLFNLNYISHIESLHTIDAVGYKYRTDFSVLSTKLNPIAKLICMAGNIRDAAGVLMSKHNYPPVYIELLGRRFEILLRSAYRHKRTREERLQVLNFVKQNLSDYSFKKISFPESIVFHGAKWLPNGLVDTLSYIMYLPFRLLLYFRHRK